MQCRFHGPLLTHIMRRLESAHDGAFKLAALITGLGDIGGLGVQAHAALQLAPSGNTARFNARRAFTERRRRKKKTSFCTVMGRQQAKSEAKSEA